MRRLEMKLLLFFAPIIFFWACKSHSQNNESNIIQKVRYGQVGGRKISGDFFVEIDKDSTFMKENGRILLREKTSVEIWKIISNSISVNQLIEQEKNSIISRNEVDGDDDLYEIETLTKKYSFLNIITSKNEIEANNFKKKLDTEFWRLWRLYQGTSH